MRPDELRASGEVAATGYGNAVEIVRDTHEAISDRVFRALGPAAEPVRLSHDAIAAVAYGATRGIGRAVVRAGALGASLARAADAPSLQESSLGRFAVGALSGAFGDQLAARESPLAARMTIRRDGPATPRLAVFVHGLCETEDAWALRRASCKPYGARLRDELGYTPLYVRYNSGLSIAENGRELSAQLTELVRDWPVDVAEIALIGHSMGGLVARSACSYDVDRSDPTHPPPAWSPRVRHVFTLGTPYLGAPLEVLAARASRLLGWLPETRAFGAALDARSVAIKEMGRAFEGLPLGSAHHYFVSASLTREHDHPLGRHVGDLLVLHASAWEHRVRTERLPFPVDHYRHVGGASHFDLLNHPVIGEQIVRWIAGRPALPAPPD